MNVDSIKVGATVKFSYNGKIRMVKVMRKIVGAPLTDAYLHCQEIDTNKFKNFTIAKIEGAIELIK